MKSLPPIHTQMHLGARSLIGGVGGYRQIFLLLLFPLFSLSSCTLTGEHDPVIKIVSYNVQGSFGDTEKEARKAEEIAYALQRYRIDDSAVILFQEVDNRRMIEELMSEHLVLTAFRYAVVAPLHNTSITQAVISKYPLKEPRFHTIAHDGFRPTRGFLEVSIEIDGRTLLLYNLHLKSKRGGAEETEPQRAAVMRALASHLRTHVERINPSEIVIAGDMNSEVAVEVIDPGNPPALRPYAEDQHASTGLLRIAQLMDVPDLQADGDSMIFVSPWEAAEGEGSYLYRGEWEQIDHFFLSQSLFDNQYFQYRDFYVAQEAEESGERAGSEPAQSDHLPIVLEVILR